MFKSIRPFLFAAVLTVFSAAPLWAADEPSAPPRENFIVSLIVTVLPFALVGLFIWYFFVRRMGNVFQRSPAYYDRSEQHMQRMEQLLERVAVALEKKDKSIL